MNSDVNELINQNSYLSQAYYIEKFFFSHPFSLLLIIPLFINAAIVSSEKTAVAMAINAIGTMDQFEQIKKAALMYFFVCIFGSIVQCIGTKGWETIASQIGFKLRKKVFKKLLEQDIDYIDNHSVDELLRIALNLPAMYEECVRRRFRTISIVFDISNDLVSISRIDWKATAIVCIVGISICILNSDLSEDIHSITRTIRNKTYKIIKESIENIRVIQAFNQQMNQIEKLEKCYEKNINKIRISMFSRSWLSVSFHFVKSSLLALLELFVAHQVMRGNLKPGSLYVMWKSANRFIHKVRDAFNHISFEINIHYVCRSILDILDSTPEIDINQGLQPNKFHGLIEFKNVWFKYPSSESWILKDVSFVLQPNHSVAIVGGMDSGRTTILQLILRFYDVSAGLITVDGINIRDLNPRWLRKHFGIALSHAQLMKGSIMENIKYGRPSLDFDVIQRITKSLGIAETIESLPDGYNTPLEVGKDHLTLGELKLIQVARAFAMESEFLVIDEDFMNEKGDDQKISFLSSHFTLIIVPIDLQITRNIDHILVMHQGSLVEEGDYHQCIAMNGEFCRLLYDQ